MMLVNVRLATKPYPRTPLHSAAHEYTGVLDGPILWVQARVAPDCPMGWFGIHLSNNAVVTPQDSVPEAASRHSADLNGLPQPARRGRPPKNPQ